MGCSNTKSKCRAASYKAIAGCNFTAIPPQRFLPQRLSKPHCSGPASARLAPTQPPSELTSLFQTHSLHAEGLSQTLAPQGKLSTHREPASSPAPCCNTLRLVQAHKYTSPTLPWNTVLPAPQSRHTVHVPSRRSNGLMHSGIRYTSISDALQRSELVFGAARTCIRQVFRIWGPEQVLHDGAEA